MEIYFDFSGYSLMAMGLGRMLGIELDVYKRQLCDLPLPEEYCSSMGYIPRVKDGRDGSNHLLTEYVRMGCLLYTSRCV